MAVDARQREEHQQERQGRPWRHPHAWPRNDRAQWPLSPASLLLCVLWFVWREWVVRVECPRVAAQGVSRAVQQGTRRQRAPVDSKSGQWTVDYTERPCAPLAVRPRGAPLILRSWGAFCKVDPRDFDRVTGIHLQASPLCRTHARLPLTGFLSLSLSQTPASPKRPDSKAAGDPAAHQLHAHFAERGRPVLPRNSGRHGRRVREDSYNRIISRAAQERMGRGHRGPVRRREAERGKVVKTSPEGHAGCAVTG